VVARAFASAEAFREWLGANHGETSELLIRLYKTQARRKGMTYREALDEALCFGWIDGVRRALDADSFIQRFSPRRAKSYWSLVNIRRFRELATAGRTQPPGLRAFEARDENQRRAYSFESRPRKPDAWLLKRLAARPRALDHFRAQPPGYQRLASFWVMSAKREKTRVARLTRLMAASAKGERLAALQGKPNQKG
jgi:uncharacterized protein YdeI (YjbR/CyaY-like superfamily)